MGNAEARLYGRAQTINDASIRLGGVTLYSKNETVLLSTIQVVSDVICRHSASELSLSRKYLQGKVRDEIHEANDDRIFGALLGYQLRLGRIDVVLCAAFSGKSFRALVHASRLSQFEESVETTWRRLKTRRIVQVMEIEELMFRDRNRNTRSSANDVLAHLAYQGTAHYLSTMTFALSEFDDALR